MERDILRSRRVPALLPVLAALFAHGCSSYHPAVLPEQPDAAAADAGLQPPGPTVSVLAGAPATGFADGESTQALFNGIGGAAVLPDGSAMLVTDTFNATLRRITLPSGLVQTVAGRVQVAAVADGSGLAARFQSPRALVMNAAGTVAYLADGPTLRRVTLPRYEVTTLAGVPGMAGYADGKGDAARLGYLLHALALSVDEKVLYIADRSNRVLRSLNLDSLEVRTLAGSPYTGANQSVDGVGPAARLSGMGGIVLRGDDLYVVDTFNHTLRSVSLKTLEVKTLVGVPGMAGLEDGPSATARLRTPQGLVAAGDALYSVSFDGVLREIALTDFSVETVLGDASDPRARDGVGPEVRLGLGFAQPAPDPRGALYYLDRSANSVRRIDLSLRSVQTVAGPSEPEASRDGELAAARFVSPAALAATADGARFYVADDTAGCIRIIERADARVRTLAGQCGTPGSSDGTLLQARFNSPRGLALSEQTETLFVADAEGATVRAIDLKAGSVRTLAGAAGQHEARDGATAAARLVRPIALALDPGRQRLYVAESVGPGSLTGFPMGRAALRLIDLLSGQTSTLAGGDRAAAPLDGPLSSATFQSPAALALAGGQLFVAEPGLATIRLIRLEDGTVTTLAGKIGETGPADGSFAEARFDTPSGLAVSAGEQALYVTDSGTNSIRRIDLNARHVTTWLGDPAVSGGFPSGVQQRFDAATLYFPSAPVIAGGGLAYVSEGAVYFARPQKEITR